MKEAKETSRKNNKDAHVKVTIGSLDNEDWDGFIEFLTLNFVKYGAKDCATNIDESVAKYDHMLTQTKGKLICCGFS